MRKLRRIRHAMAGYGHTRSYRYDDWDWDGYGRVRHSTGRIRITEGRFFK